MTVAAVLSAAGIPGDQLAAIAELWKRQNKTMTVSFDGVSMLPSIAPSENIQLICDRTEPRVGEVIVFLYGSHLAVHRLLARSRDSRWLLTRGDALFLPDLPVEAGSIIGRIAEKTGAPARPAADPLFSALFAISVGAARAIIFMLASMRNMGVAVKRLWRR